MTFLYYINDELSENLTSNENFFINDIIYKDNKIIKILEYT